ncbi:MAG TPA: SOS response-associated peptidase [Stellaceae bacterium]|nr:SOS response-associated peptidase [Stellaceae bacterium]
MCGRYLLKTALEELARIFGFIERPNLAPRYNIAPTLEVPVIRQRREPAGQRSIAALRWGLVQPWADDPKAGPPLINARAETLLEKPAFRGATQKRRCLVPADGYYQWREGDTSKQPYLIARRDRAPLAFAGLWERWGPRHDPAAALDSFTIITTDANEFLSGFHHRMPVVLTPENYATWLDPESPVEAALELLTPSPNDLLEAVPLDRAVNSNRADGPDLLKPVGPVESWPTA